MKEPRSLLLVLGSIGGIWIVIFGVLKWGEYLLNSKPPVLEVSPPSRSPDEPLPVLWEIPLFSAVDQNGQRVTTQDLRGRVWIANFIFTRCTAACPLLTAQMVLLQRAVRHPDVRFLSFSVDPDYDTPTVLKQYAAVWKGDEARWFLLHMEREMLYRTAAGLRVAVLPLDDPVNPILHSNLFFLIDQEGRVRGLYDSNDSEAMKQLANDALALAGGDRWLPASELVAEESAAQVGERLYASLGCAACHTHTTIAPPLAGLFGKLVTLNDGRTVLADEKYVREAILDPAAHLVTGYLPLMPSYRGYLTDDELDHLVAYIRAQGGSPTTLQSADVSLAVDPVCKMEVRSGNDTPHLQHEGQTYYFCSEHCRATFRQNPARYVAPAKQVVERERSPR